MNKLKYIARRLVLTLITLLIITFVVFVVIQLPPGDYVDTLISNMIAEGQSVSDLEAARLREIYGVDRPLIVQYASWLKGVVTGDWGVSFYYNQGVLIKIGETLGITIGISFISLLFTYLVSVPIAIYSSRHQYSIGDYVFTIIGFIGLAIPNFLLAILLMYFTYVWTGVAQVGLPEYGVTNWAEFLGWLKALVIPIVVIGTAGACGLIRSVRAQLLDEKGKPYVLALRAKGVSELTIVYKYQLRAVLNPIVSGLGGMVSGIFNGSTITAIVLMLPMMGPVLFKALQTQDIYLAGGILLISAMLVVVGNLVGDLLLVLLDPRIQIIEGGE